MKAAQPVFLYDFNSPYAYLAATRVDTVLPVTPRWQPVTEAAITAGVIGVPTVLAAGQRFWGTTA